MISEGDAVTDRNGNVELYCQVSGSEKKKKASFRCFPALAGAPEGFIQKSEGKAAESFATGDAFALYEAEADITCDLDCNLKKVSETEYDISVPGSAKGADELFLVVDYEAEAAKLLDGDDAMTDSFYTGQEWEIGLKRYYDRRGESEGSFDIKCVLEPLKEGEKLYLQEWPVLEDGRACRINNIQLVAQYRIKIS